MTTELIPGTGCHGHTHYEGCGCTLQSLCCGCLPPRYRQSSPVEPAKAAPLTSAALEALLKEADFVTSLTQVDIKSCHRCSSNGTPCRKHYQLALIPNLASALRQLLSDQSATHEEQKEALEEVCESCGEPATHTTADDVAVCAECLRQIPAPALALLESASPCRGCGMSQTLCLDSTLHGWDCCSACNHGPLSEKSRHISDALLSATEEAAFKAGFNAFGSDDDTVWDFDGPRQTRWEARLSKALAAYRQSRAGSVK